MASWPAIIVWCSAAILEFVGKCVPVIDQIMDAAMAFVVPFIVSFFLDNVYLLVCQKACLLYIHDEHIVSELYI